MLISPAICTALLLSPQITLRNMYEITFVAQIAVIFYVLFRIKETKRKTVGESRTSLSRYLKDVVKQRDFQGLSASQLLFNFSYSNINTYLQIFAKQNLNYSDAQVSSFRIYANAATLIIRFLSATILTKFQPGKVYIAFLFLGGITCSLSPFATNYVLMTMIQFLNGMSYGAVRTLASVLVTNMSTDENRGASNNFLQGFQSTGSVIILGTSPIANTYGIPSVFVLGGIVGITAPIPQLLKELEATHHKNDSKSPDRV